MAKKLDGTKVKMGSFIPVYNLEKRTSEAPNYYALKVEDQSGKNESWHLFTEREINILTYAECDVCKDFKCGRLYYRHRVGRSDTWNNFVVLNFPVRELQPDGSGIKFKTEQKLVMLSDAVLKKTEERAKKNPEDIPEMGWLEDLKD